MNAYMHAPPGGTASGIAVRGVTATYRNGQTALRNVSFEIPAGTITALVGVNGSGKSTLFKSIMGFVPVSTGTISILGQPVARALKGNLVAYVPQSEEVDWNFPVLVYDVVMMGRYGHMNMLRIPRRRDREAVDAALQRVGMADFGKRQIGELSGGQRKRVFLAPWHRKLASFSWTSRSRASTSGPRRRSSPFSGPCATRAAWCWCPPTTWAACRSSATARCS